MLAQRVLQGSESGTNYVSGMTKREQYLLSSLMKSQLFALQANQTENNRVCGQTWGISSDTQLVFCGGYRGRWLTGAIGPSCRNGTLRLRRRWGDFSGEDDSPADD